MYFEWYVFNVICYLTAFIYCQTFFQRMELALESVCVAYALVGGVILIVMSALAVGALRSVKTQVRKRTHRSQYLVL